MSDHYYSSKPVTAHNRKTWEATLRGRLYKFVSDAGVFSKQGVDFGSRVLIDAMEIPEDASVLDVGCGYGPMGMAAAGLASRGRVTLIDVNERAIELAKENVSNNGIKNVTVIQSDLYKALGDEKFDVILTNPPIRAGKATVHAIFEGAADRLNEGGSLWVVIQKKQGAPSAKEKLESLFGEVEEVTKEKGYRIFRATKK
ncbi:class I SAM-dependent methyltransferase [Paenibacillus sp. YPG26]|uniref:class I SAM-dependent methyltransferase n=1 Tax=Paenibacillus sp. YPG26 TaxID=2878915 RepID=UPI00203C22BE|nr:class I SAM-dependent methyltransferase [Paenibacillus sp. YPG26]USB32764.1 class I SAM-dependent methyltransferase [Paenibacillus sp. YPG26]